MTRPAPKKRGRPAPTLAAGDEVAEPLTIRLTPTDRARAEALRADGESLGDVVRTAINLLADLAPLATREAMSPLDLARAIAKDVNGEDGELADLARDMIALVEGRRR